MINHNLMQDKGIIELLSHVEVVVINQDLGSISEDQIESVGLNIDLR